MPVGPISREHTENGKLPSKLPDCIHKRNAMPNDFIVSTTPASTPSYSGTPAPSPADAGTLATAAFEDSTCIDYGNPFPQAVLQGVPSNVRVQLTLASGITQLGPNQYAVSLSLSGTSTVQLTPNAADAQQDETEPVSPNSFTWSFVSRNVNVATVNSSGLVTAVGRGECEILISSTRAVNASFTGATPSGTEGVQASLNVRVVA
jgi:hypothetical protein